MHYGNIKYLDIANGEGVRTTLFVSGCTHHCKGCFQPETWDFTYGKAFNNDVVDKILKSLEPAYVDGLTILGGEPFEPRNQPEILDLLLRVRKSFPQKTIWVYTGDCFEDISDPQNERHTKSSDAILQNIDVLVDGPFCEDLHDISLRFRGSSNQRIIDVSESLKQEKLVLWKDAEVYAGRGYW